MNRKRTLYILAAVLVIEGIAVVAVHSRLPRAARAITLGINLIAAAAVVQIARTRK